MKGPFHNERGFTLPELMIVIVLLGILAAMAMPVWWGVVESRKVESATNQVVADLRLAHTQATNRLVSREVLINPSTSPNCAPGYGYRIVGGGSPTTRCLPEGITMVETSSPPTPVFVLKPDGTVEPSGGSRSIRVAAEDGYPYRDIEINTQTSRVKVD